METLQLIGVAVSIVAAVLAGVWFIIHKSFGVGRVSQRIDEVEKRTVNAACLSHGMDISAVKDDIKSIKADVVAIKSLLTLKHKDAAAVFSIKNSPRQLNELGKQLLADIKGHDFLEQNKDVLFAHIDASAPKTALDVEVAALDSCTACADSDVFNRFKNFIYNSPSYMVKDKDGHDRPYDLSVPDVCFVLSLPLRDMYLQEHPQILTE